MLDPERRLEGETPEDYARRISKFPALHPNTILRVVFRTVNQDNLKHIKDWARPVFQKAFPPEDNRGIPFIEPENISTKDFSKWVAKENMFEAWKSLGEKPSPIAELFIDLVTGKTTDREKLSQKASPKSPHPVTDKAKKNRLREDYISAVKKMLLKNPNLKWPDFKDSPNLKNLLRESGLPYEESTLQRKWIPEARQLAKVKGTPGAPEKK